MIKYTGFIRKIRYYSESSHYIVALLEVEEEQKLITMNGYMSNFNIFFMVIMKFILNMDNN